MRGGCALCGCTSSRHVGGEIPRGCSRTVFDTRRLPTRSASRASWPVINWHESLCLEPAWRCGTGPQPAASLSPASPFSILRARLQRVLTGGLHATQLWQGSPRSDRRRRTANDAASRAGVADRDRVSWRARRPGVFEESPGSSRKRRQPQTRPRASSGRCQPAPQRCAEGFRRAQWLGNTSAPTEAGGSAGSPALAATGAERSPRCGEGSVTRGACRRSRATPGG
jgi:hypothetical protein